MAKTREAAALQYLRDNWQVLRAEEKRRRFFALPRYLAEELFSELTADDQVEILSRLPDRELRSWLRFLPPDDAADFVQKMPEDKREAALSLLDEKTKREIMGLMAYAEDEAGGLMSPRYYRLRPEMTADEAIRYIGAQGHHQLETIYYAYVLDSQQTLLGTASFRELLLADKKQLVRDFMNQDIISVPEEMNREEVADVFSKNSGLMAVPVVGDGNKMKGIVTFDDIASVIEQEATEDIQKLGGMEALDAPYFSVSFRQMIVKRAGWLTALFLGEMFTASAMANYESEIQKAVVLALFIPLIISSGGNSGSQASSLIIRSLALREIRLRDWWRVLARELYSGLALGAILGTIGLVRVMLWQQWRPIYGEHYMLIAVTVAFSLVGVVLWGTLTGSMLPFILRRLGFDPASASAPFVATLVDVTGLVIYFSFANVFLSGILI